MSGGGIDEGSFVTSGGARPQKAIVRDGYGSPDVLQLREVDKLIIGDDRVLVRV